jgi:excisionase family DNA binding protein
MRHDQHTFSTEQVAQRYGVNADKVRLWIAANELRAINVATRRGGRPRWRISLDALLVFEQARAATAAVPTARRRQQAAAGVIEYF